MRPCNTCFSSLNAKMTTVIPPRLRYAGTVEQARLWFFDAALKPSYDETDAGRPAVALSAAILSPTGLKAPVPLTTRERREATAHQLTFEPGRPSPDKKGCMRTRSERGFSMIEMAIVISILMIASGICFISLKPAMQQNRVSNAYNLTLSSIRTAREAAVSQRRIYIVTFSNGAVPNTVTVTQAATGTLKSSISLPNDITFRTETGIPTSSNSTPDGFGTGAKAIDFDQGVGSGGLNTIYFYPDGSSHDSAGNFNSGVLYLARTGELMSSRAVTVWALTGRIRGWRLEKNGSSNTYYWRQE